MFRFLDNIDNYRQHFDELQEMFLKLINQVRSRI